MLQLLSRKNKKGAAFFVRQRLLVLLFSCMAHSNLLQQKKRPSASLETKERYLSVHFFIHPITVPP